MRKQIDLLDFIFLWALLSVGFVIGPFFVLYWYTPVISWDVGLGCWLSSIGIAFIATLWDAARQERS